MVLCQRTAGITKTSDYDSRMMVIPDRGEGAPWFAKVPAKSALIVHIGTFLGNFKRSELKSPYAVKELLSTLASYSKTSD